MANTDHRTGHVVSFKDEKGVIKAGKDKFPFSSTLSFRKGDPVTFRVYTAASGKTATQVKLA